MGLGAPHSALAQETDVEITERAMRVEPPIQGRATTYGPAYDGRPLGCGGTFWNSDPTVVAVGPARYQEWPCGTEMLVSGPAGRAMLVRRDSCPGCGPNLIDLSDAANRLVCGVPVHTCEVTIEVLR